MKERQNLIPYVLETTPRPGMRETRVRMAPSVMRVRNGRQFYE